MNRKEQLEVLYQRYQDNLCSEEEFMQLLDLLSSENEETRQEVLSLFEATWNNLIVFPGQFNIPQTMITALKDIQEDTGNNSDKVISINRRRSRIKYIAAAAVFVLLAIGLWWFKSQDKQATTVAITATQQEIQPGWEGAILTLADGRQIILDSTQGNIALDGGAKIINEEGKLTYQKENTRSEVVYNLMTTPRGRTYSLVLSDGTKVWLNASSSIRYPTAFTGNQRNVEITGEAYFEVAHNASRPFIVSVPSSAERMPSSLGVNEGSFKVEVLGTRFNINAYTNEGSISTTLLEGKVKLNQGTKIAMLKPGQQGIMQASQLTIENDIDLEKITAWKENKFYFQDDNLEKIMRQLERWYNINVVYDDKLSKQYTGIISRNVPLSKVLQLFERTAEVKFFIVGNTVHVQAAK
jgi:transmembrane sensor